MTANNFSATNQVISINYSGRTYSILTDRQISADVDFLASTLAINTECKPITRSGCTLNAPNNFQFGEYNCSRNFTGSFEYGVGGDYVPLVLYRSAYNPDSGNSSDFSNPTSIKFAFSIYDYISEDSKFPLANDSEILYKSNLGYAFILECNSTVYNVTYTWVNGSVAYLSTSLIDLEVVGNIVSNQETLNGTYQVQIAAVMAGYTSNTSQSLANEIAFAYSQNAVAYVAGQFAPLANEKEVRRTTIFVSRVPLAPLLSLIVANCLYVAVSLVVAIIALRVTEEGSREIQKKLSIWGLVLHAFPATKEDHDDAKASVIGVQGDDADGWGFRTWNIRA